MLSLVQHQQRAHRGIGSARSAPRLLLFVNLALPLAHARMKEAEAAWAQRENRGKGEKGVVWAGSGSIRCVCAVGQKQGAGVGRGVERLGRAWAGAGWPGRLQGMPAALRRAALRCAATVGVAVCTTVAGCLQ
eukprot:80623-Chlamydomonas_euryale.AAC.2